ncbi:lysophospholipid acyltransferase family protein [Rhizohabitans arisaemae]|uniref:lysophospholipid acyltransferase family protein n=1 Tax=Rhizohabitans arisaemae TaxID=2720610 RepID=UPI0024B0D1D2|nr:lysophospholipid acyltransferase family protein [Rhizohabitans arisaemae]
MKIREAGFWPLCWMALLKATLSVLTRRRWAGLANIPRTGGAIVVAGHVSEFDPLVVARFVYAADRWPRFLAKSSLFERSGLLGAFMRTTGHIPVARGTATASQALDRAVEGLRKGDLVIIYPEGGIPASGEPGPRKGKTGAARLFLATGAPVVPVVSWGPQWVLNPRVGGLRTDVTVLAGPPLDLAKWAGAEPGDGNLREITETIMSALYDLLEEAKEPPADRSPPRCVKC